ncbi:unnamed protein product [Closterium sp. Yama58-4]|nr:unnamed protein product [Closterium sp. Yama58-4]
MSFDLSRYLLTSLVLISLLSHSHLAVCSTHDNGADDDSPRTASQPLAQTLHPDSLVLPRRRLQAGAAGRRGKIQLERPVAAAEPQHQAVIDGGVRPVAVTASKPPVASLQVTTQGRRAAADNAAGNAGSREKTQGGGTLKEGILGKSLTQVGLIDYFSKRIGLAAPVGQSKSKPRLPLCPEFAPPLSGASSAVVSACQWGDPLPPSYSATAAGLGSSGSDLGPAELGGPGKAAQFMEDWLRWKQEGGEAAERECMRQRAWFYAGIAEETCDLSALRAAQAASPRIAAGGVAAADVDGSGGGILVLRDVYVNAQGLVFNKSHVFVVDRCGSGQWKQQQQPQKQQQQQVKVPSYPPGTRVTVHPHLINLLPYEGHEEEEEDEQGTSGGGKSGSNGGGNPEGREWVAQAKLHNSKERLVARLLPVLFLLSSALMPAARRFPLLLADRHVLFHLGLGVFSTDLSSLAISPESALLGDSRDHLFFAKQLYMVSSVLLVCCSVSLLLFHLGLGVFGTDLSSLAISPESSLLGDSREHLFFAKQLYVVKGGVAFAEADEIARQGGPDAVKKWRVREELKYEWVVPKERCPAVAAGAFGSLFGPESEREEAGGGGAGSTDYYETAAGDSADDSAAGGAAAAAAAAAGADEGLFSRFDGRSLCQLARLRDDGLRIAFLGDSLSKEAHTSFLNNMLKHVPKPALKAVTFRKCMPWLGTHTGYCHERFTGLGCSGLELHLVFNKRLMPVDSEKDERLWWKNMPWLDDPGIANSHVLVINRGAHVTTDEHLVTAVRRTLQFVRQNYPEKLVVFRSTAPGHMGCTNATGPIKQRQDPKTLPFGWGNFKRQNELLRGVVEEMGAVFMDIEPMTALRPDGHRGRITEQKTDCLHYCSPGPEDAWSEYLYNIIQRIVPEY